jgi:predicted 3-demethylubiquinone-9 3-methyltransferase (glyoxalase superfamily)
VRALRALFASRPGVRHHGFRARTQIRVQRSDISFIVPCDTQEEIDYFWGKLSAEPKAEQCGWLEDKYGVSWQITPAAMQELLGGDDRKRIERVTQAFLKMKKFDIATFKRAAAG